MTTHNNNSDNDQRNRDVGEQAAQVIGEFVSMANQFSKKLDEQFSRTSNDYKEDVQTGNQDVHKDGSPDRDTASRDELEPDWSKAGEYLRELREATGQTVDAFAKAIKGEIGETVINAKDRQQQYSVNDDRSRVNATGRVGSFGENGTEWLQQLGELIKQGDPTDVLEKIRNGFQAPETIKSSKDSSSDDSIASRRLKLQSIFSEEEIDNLTDEQFHELVGFIKSSYHSALQHVRDS